MKPTSWIDAFVGICCLLVALWMIPEILLEYFQLNSYVRMGFGIIMEYMGLIVGFLLLGSIGVGLLTGEYRKHQKGFHRIWLALAALAITSLLLSWIWVSGAP